MKDFNFFAPYTGSRKGFKKEYLYAAILSIALVLVITFTYAFNYFKISKLNSEIEGIQQNLNLKENMVKLKEIEAEEKKLAIMNQYYGIVSNISDDINKKDFVGTKLINKINGCVPEGVYFKVMVLDGEGLQMQAEGKDRESIAVFERTLRNLDVVKDVHIATINSSTKENKNFTFSINCTLTTVQK